MSRLPVVFRVLDETGTDFIAPRQENGHGSSPANPTYAGLTDNNGNALEFLNDTPPEGQTGLPVRLVGGHGRASIHNSSTTPLSAGATYTGTEELNNYADALVTCFTDQAGTLYVDLSPDGTNWDSTISYSVDASLHELHRVVKAARWIRLRFQNTSASAQTFFRLNVYFGSFNTVNVALNAIVQEDADAIVTRTIDAEITIASGRFQGYSIVNKFGTNSDIGTSSVPEDIWEVGGAYTGFPDSALETIAVLSSSASDTSAGTGARQVQVSGLDGNYNQVNETITLNGTTPVNSVTQFRRVHTATVIAAGSGGVNVGTITVRHTTTTANVFLSIAPGRNQSNCSAYTVPAGYTAYMRQLHCTVRGTNQVTQSQAVEGNIWTRSFGRPFRSRRPFTVVSSYRMLDQIYGGILFTEKSDIVLRITVASANSISVSGGYDLILVKNI